LSRKMCAASAGKGRLTQRQSSSILSMREGVRAVFAT
jgi:hypothetical protein